MISKDVTYLNKVVFGNIADIDGYDEAVNSEKLYELHHKLETPTFYGLMPESFGLSKYYNTPENLKEKNLYFQRPPEELIFLERNQHISLHKIARKEFNVSTKKKGQIYQRHSMWMRVYDRKTQSYSDWKAEGVKLRTDRLYGNNLCKVDGYIYQFLGSNLGRLIRCNETGEVHTSAEWLAKGYNAVKSVSTGLKLKRKFSFEYV